MSSPVSRRLSLGPGEFLKEGYVNVDYYSLSSPDVAHDLNQIPYPFPDDDFELIEADHVLDHLQDPFRVLGELRRIGAHGALIHLLFRQPVCVAVLAPVLLPGGRFRGNRACVSSQQISPA